MLKSYFIFSPTATYPLSVGQLSTSITERVAPTVVENGGQVVAFADLYRVKHSDYCNIGNVIVAPEARGRGMARYLIAQMIKIARRKQGAKEVRISCFNHNTAGLLLYTGLGFHPYGLEERARLARGAGSAGASAQVVCVVMEPGERSYSSPAYARSPQV